MTKRTAHIVSHTHWDREWYLPYEKHHVRLVELMDTLLDTLESDPGYRSFFLDGQTIILEDYLQVRPEHRARLEKLIQDDRILIGPWYILQDAFLTSGEANVRNMQIGHEDAARWGKVSKIGYFPDTFGLFGQSPQLMQQSGIDNAFFGRGVKPTGFNNEVGESEAYESSFSELIWEGPDGSQVLGILFANWYSNGNEVPTDKAAAQEYWNRKLAEAGKYASTPHLLFMNGCDHQPIQTDLAQAIEVAGEVEPDVEFIHSNFPDYLDAVREIAGDRNLSVVKGELRSQRTDGWGTLVNTASSRVYLKQMNTLGQAMLERVAEPLAAYGQLTGKKYPQHLFTYAWKQLMQNHPHDSICGCSVDEVHREMVTRFDKSRHVAETIVSETAAFIAEAVDTSVFGGYGSDALPVVVYNTTGWTRSGAVSVEVDVARVYYREGVSFPEMNRRMNELDITGRVLVDAAGSPVHVTVEDLGQLFGYDLPDDAFRQPYQCRRVRLTFQASVPALGHAAYAWVKADAQPADASAIALSERMLDNGVLRAEVAEDGSFTLTDLRSGRVYSGLGVYENTGDIGNEYMFMEPKGTQPITTRGLAASVRVLDNEPYRASLEIVHEWSVPASADELLEREQREVVFMQNRKSGRSSELVTLRLTTVLSLEQGSGRLDITSSFNNQAKDHRVRMLFPTGLQTSVHTADSIFEAAVRDTEPAKEWVNPSNTQHQQAFVDVSGAAADGVTAGLTVANFGLNEYEVLRDGSNTIAVTLLRSTGELGDWGYFPTPEAQCIGEHNVQLAVIPHNGDGAAEGAYAEAYQLQTPWTAVQTSVHNGQLKPVGAPLAWEGEALAFSAFKVSPVTGDVVARLYNLKREAAELKLQVPAGTGTAYKSTIMEQASDAALQLADGRIELPVGPAEIVTIGLRG
ncbi:alpha-mannosidase [Paenibacillus pasadenensis]|uniref:alpha-mannosidase n=1 Tax=Paenibacillus pasadenensis TaxID=217090 RepID=UPI00203E22C0|nr:alpha-mannosidase [Paenibacillus pasadenensis]MCM3749618.1 alpha-mannosidase [Paenibacillus pasadenensis]